MLRKKSIVEQKKMFFLYPIRIVSKKKCLSTSSDTEVQENTFVFCENANAHSFSVTGRVHKFLSFVTILAHTR